MFIAQPAEETAMGAKAMLADGLFTRFPKPDFGFALHDGPGRLRLYQLSRRRRLVQFRRPRRSRSTVAAVTARCRRRPSIP